MECNVVKDLIPLYIDDCCSEESARIVKEHMENCRDCKMLYESMHTPSNVASVVLAPKKLSRINDWKASVLQSVLLFVSFAIITCGVALEAATPVGLMNGCWTFSLVIPATGFLLSLTNWYFVRLYKSRKRFSNTSLVVTLSIIICAYVWAGFHYDFHFTQLLHNVTFLYGIGILLTAVFCVLSKLFSSKYARMLGKE